MLTSLLDLPARIYRRLSGKTPDYRSYLFDQLQATLKGKQVNDILEIGPRDGIDSRRLLELKPERLVLVDLPDKEERIKQWLPEFPAEKVSLIIGNIMYDQQARDIAPADVVWCTGVLYHNPEQLRMVKRLFDLTKPGGLLVIESATARRSSLRNEACVEIWHSVDKRTMQNHHVSSNVTHMPSRLAMKAWLEMVGFTEIFHSDCHKRVSFGLHRDRAAFIAMRPMEGASRTAYYSHAGLDYQVGNAL